MSERMFPIIVSSGPKSHGKQAHTKIPWSVAEKAYPAYCDAGGRGQSLERLAERGGFYTNEMDRFYPGWRDEVDELLVLRRDLAAAQEREKALVEALHAARHFIVNGVALGFIRMPDASTPDPAHRTLPMIEDALARIKP